MKDQQLKLWKFLNSAENKESSGAWNNKRNRNKKERKTSFLKLAENKVSCAWKNKRKTKKERKTEYEGKTYKTNKTSYWLIGFLTITNAPLPAPSLSLKNSFHYCNLGQPPFFNCSLVSIIIQWPLPNVISVNVISCLLYSWLMLSAAYCIHG